MMTQSKIAFGFALTLLMGVLIAHADEVTLKNGKVIEGKVVRKDADVLVFNHEGNDIRIPMDRVEKIEEGTMSRSVQETLAEIDTLLGEEKLEEALHKINRMKDKQLQDPAQVAELNRLIEKQRKIGQSQRMRAEILTLIAESKKLFDLGEAGEGFSALFRAYTLDSSYAPLHEELNKQFGLAWMRIKDPAKYFSLIMSYFCTEYPNNLFNDRSNILPILATVHQARRADLYAAMSQSEISHAISQLRCIEDAYTAHPGWRKASATPEEGAVIGLPAIVRKIAEQRLASKEFPLSEFYLAELGSLEANPELYDLYARSAIANNGLEKAQGIFETYAKTGLLKDQMTLAGVRDLRKAYAARDAGDNTGAHQMMDAVFAMDQAVYPELVHAAAIAKLDYDLAKMLQLERDGLFTEAADLALRAYEIAESDRQKTIASEAFTRMSSKIQFDFEFLWVLDDHEVPLTPEIVQWAHDFLQTKYEITFDPESPFELLVILNQKSESEEEGERVAAAAARPNYLEVDLISPDIEIVKMNIEVAISHTLKPGLDVGVQVVDRVPDPIRLRREELKDLRHNKGKQVYLDLRAHGDFYRFVQNEWDAYLAPQMSVELFLNEDDEERIRAMRAAQARSEAKKALDATTEAVGGALEGAKESLGGLFND